MKKFSAILLLLVLFGTAFAQYPNPIVQRLSKEEIAECKTPSAIAYNLVDAILQKDFVKMRSYMTTASAKYYTDSFIKKEYGSEGMKSLEDFFSTGKLGILSWAPALKDGYEVVIAYVQDEWLYEKDGSRYYADDDEVKDGMVYLQGEDTPRIGINRKKIYVTCSPSSEVNNVGFQDIKRYGDTNVKVLLEKFNGEWKVTGFK